MAKKPKAKADREKQVLLGLVDTYIRTGKPVGSNTLKEGSFENLSSATIRNYFARLEEEGFLKQQHSSGAESPLLKRLSFMPRRLLIPPLSIKTKRIA